MKGELKRCTLDQASNDYAYALRFGRLDAMEPPSFCRVVWLT